jgi:phosphorylase/glycogen(starch) synthase
MNLISSEKNIAVFECNIPINQPGVFDFVFRLFPKSPLLPHRQDFNLVRWI